MMNGVRFFQRGANYLSDQFLSSMTTGRYRQDVERCGGQSEHGAPFAVVEKQAFTTSAIAANPGLPGFPMWLTMSNHSDLVRRANQQLKELIAQFHHHPSIGIWNFEASPARPILRRRLPQPGLPES
jgi:hypothetical protein